MPVQISDTWGQMLEFINTLEKRVEKVEKRSEFKKGGIYQWADDEAAARGIGARILKETGSGETRYVNIEPVSIAKPYLERWTHPSGGEITIEHKPSFVKVLVNKKGEPMTNATTTTQNLNELERQGARNALIVQARQNIERARCLLGNAYHYTEGEGDFDGAINDANKLIADSKTLWNRATRLSRSPVTVTEVPTKRRYRRRTARRGRPARAE